MSKKEYADEVYSFLMQQKPGTRLRVASSQDPEKFINTVKELMDNWGLRGMYSFNSDYTLLIKHS